MLAEVNQIHVDQVVARDLLGCVRHHDLAPVRRGRHPGRPVHRGAVVVAVAQLGRAGVEAHPHLQRLGEVPRLGPERPLRGDGGADRVMGIGEHCVGAVARGLDDDAAVLVDRGAHDLVVAGQR